MAQEATYLTPAGLKKLEEELEHLRGVRRLQVAERIQQAKEIGGSEDNAEYDEAKDEQSFVEGRVLTLEGMVQKQTSRGAKVEPMYFRWLAELGTQ